MRCIHYLFLFVLIFVFFVKNFDRLKQSNIDGLHSCHDILLWSQVLRGGGALFCFVLFLFVFVFFVKNFNLVVASGTTRRRCPSNVTASRSSERTSPAPCATSTWAAAWTSACTKQATSEKFLSVFVTNALVF